MYVYIYIYIYIYTCRRPIVTAVSIKLLERSKMFLKEFFSSTQRSKHTIDVRVVRYIYMYIECMLGMHVLYCFVCVYACM
jgi:hypothetical protein